ncbi:MAG: HAD family hydrolase [Planctomycetota bacterium]|jgi:phosphoglycolate phosphatase-like HAD superfamily hydrolase
MPFQGVLTEEQVRQDPQQQIRNWQRAHDFAVCIDTDGCVLDNMWAKQVIVFHPHFMHMNGLRDVEMFFRIHAEHHNLWATTRGCDRYLAVCHTLRSLLEDPQAQDALPRQHVQNLLASVQGYVDFVEGSGGQRAFGIRSLFEYHERNGLDFNVTRLLAWSEAVNRSFRFVTLGMPPFEGVGGALECLAQRADLLVVSATPYGDLAQWWTRAEVSQYVQAIAGKEMGKKADHIRLLKEAGGYKDGQVMMIGDGGGDLKAARANGALFYPTPAGRELEAWRDAREAFDAFFNDQYRGALEEEKVAEFRSVLLDRGPWELEGYEAREEYGKLQDKRIETYGLLHPHGRLFVLAD